VQASLPPSGPTGSHIAHWQSANGTTVTIPRQTVAFGGVHSIAPRVDTEGSDCTAAWICVTDHYAHVLRQVQHKGAAVPAVTGLTFKNAAGHALFPKDANDTFIILSSEPFFIGCQRRNPTSSEQAPWRIGKDAVKWAGSIDLGPAGTHTLADDPHAPGVAYRVVSCASDKNFEVDAPAGMEARAKTMLAALNAARTTYAEIWGYATPKRKVRLAPILFGAAGVTNAAMIQVRLFDMLLAAPETWNPAGEFERIFDHELFHVVQAVPEAAGKRNIYVGSGWYGESLPQVAYNRVYQRSYGANVATADRSCYVTEFMKRQAKQPSNAGWGREVIWEEVIHRSGEQAHRDAAHLMATSAWSGWAVAGPKIAAVLGAYFKVTGINFGYVARLAGDTVTDADIQQAAGHL
jgi:hypothetical protein